MATCRIHCRCRGSGGLVSASLMFVLSSLGLLSSAWARYDDVVDPSKGEVPLPCANGWNARLVLDVGDVGIWTVKAFQVFEPYATPEIVALDDRGRCQVLVGYSGKWKPIPRVHDGAWLGGLTHGDVDPRIDGKELYTGGRAGNLYQLVPYHHGALDARLIAYLPGREIHTILSGDLDPSHPGSELLVFTRPGGLYRVSPTAKNGRFDVTFLGDVPGRVRDAHVVATDHEDEQVILTVSRDGHMRSLVLADQGPIWRTIHRETMGMGRMASRVLGNGEQVFYVSLDDGRILRFDRLDRDVNVETIYAGPQGPRGVAAGRFYEDPEIESVAVFGYGKAVEILSREAGASWTVETIFEDRDKGHWLTVAELDGRNGTDEIVGAGYGGRVFMLARPPGFALEGLGIDNLHARWSSSDEGELEAEVGG